MTERFRDGFAGRVAVVTGGGTGMGRELVRQLTADGCDVATCDVLIDNAEATRELCRADGNRGEVLVHRADVSSEDDVRAFADAVGAWRPAVHLLFNNAGIGGSVSIVNGERAQWERVFDVCWYGVYYSTITFLPQLLRADVAHVVNTSSVNGFWASVGPTIPHSPYSAAKFAVKGFTEALITDFAVNAPHVHASVVMPGHIGTAISTNSDKLLGLDDPEKLRARYIGAGLDPDRLSPEEMLARMERRGERFRDTALTSAADAARIILDGVRADRWRILVGEDAHIIDELVRADPEAAYTEDTFRTWNARVEQVRAGG